MSSPIPESPYEQHIGTNYTPTDDQVKELRQYATQYDAQVAQVDEELAALQRKRDRLKALADGHKALSSITRRLPVDVMHSIFERCTPRPRHYAIMSSSHAPLLLTRVCRSWREIALNHAPLWSSLHIPIPSHPDVQHYVPGAQDDFDPDTMLTRRENRLTEEQREVFAMEVERWKARVEKRKEMVATWLSRAKGTNLFLSIAAGHNGDEHSERFFKEIVGVLRPYMPQVEKLKVFGPDMLAIHLLSIPAGETPRIRTITIDLISSTGIRDWMTASQEAPKVVFPPGSMVTAPSLKILSIEGSPQKLQEIPVTKANLTELYLCGRSGATSCASPMYFTPTSALNLLEQCPNLGKCALTLGMDPFVHEFHHLAVMNGIISQDPQEERTTPVSLPHLHTLLIEQEGNQSIQLFIDLIDLPALRNLGMTRSVTPCPASPAPLIQFMRKWGHNLKALFFDYRELTTDELKTCLEFARNVEELNTSFSRTLGRRRYRHSPWDDDLFNPTQPSQNNRPAPALFNNPVLALLTPRLGEGSPLDVLCPKLTYFRVQLATAEFSEEALLQFIRGRRHRQALQSGLAKLTKVKVGFAIDGPKGGVKRQQAHQCSHHRRSNLPGGTEDHWPLFRTIMDDPDVDLRELKVEVGWRQSPWKLDGHHLHGLQAHGSTADALWDPAYGLRAVVDH
ncbi:hypothetical protein CC2G_004704 [Coprinopsis cinerea AmutBmut pab1-1]|nr:hypothetical protein CC2G_004704 [Coprinopsis cinerea AmutBmut pab1-1]